MSSVSLGVTFPLQLSTGSLGYLEVTNDVVDAIRSNVRSLLMTNWGERVMHPDLGCTLREFLFEQRTAALQAKIAARINSQLEQWMPFLSLVGLFVTFSDDDTSIPDPGFRSDLNVVYGNIHIDLFLLFPAA